MGKVKELPTYTEPSKGGVVLNNKAENAHAVLDKGDPKVNGPWLDDVRAAQEESYRKARKNALKKPAKKAASKKAASKSKKAQSTAVAKKAPTKKATKKSGK